MLRLPFLIAAYLLVLPAVTSAQGFKFPVEDKSGAQAETQSQSFSGADAQGIALTLVNEQAEEVVAKLYSEYCRQTEPAKAN